MTPDNATEPEQTLTMPVVPEADTETLPVPETEILPALAEPSFQGASLTGQPQRPFPYIAIGDWMVTAKPGFDTLPCGHCGAVFAGAAPDVLTATRTLGVLRHLAYEAGWQYDLSLAWTCPACQRAGAERAAKWDSLQTRPGVTLDDALHEHDLKARATMTAGGRYPWDYDEWRERFRPRPERCEPEPETAEGRAA